MTYDLLPDFSSTNCNENRKLLVEFSYRGTQLSSLKKRKRGIHYSPLGFTRIKNN